METGVGTGRSSRSQAWAITVPGGQGSSSQTLNTSASPTAAVGVVMDANTAAAMSSTWMRLNT